MANLTFKKEVLNKDFVITAEVDARVITPEGYEGPLSEITEPSILHGMIQRGSHMVAAKVTAAATTKGKERAPGNPEE